MLYKSWSNQVFLLTPQNVKYFLNTSSENEEIQVLKIKKDDFSNNYEVECNSVNKIINLGKFPRELIGNITYTEYDEFDLEEEEEDNFEWLTDLDEEYDEQEEEGEKEIRHAKFGIFPKFVNTKNESVSSIEIDVDHLQEDSKLKKHRYGIDLIRSLTAKWVNKQSYTKTGTIWAWGSPSVNFHHQSFSMFYAILGMPQEFRTFLNFELKKELGGYVLCDSDYVIPNEIEGWDVRCHVEDSKVWEPIDEISWKEV
jgi:hypothetical protein